MGPPTLLKLRSVSSMRSPPRPNETVSQSTSTSLLSTNSPTVEFELMTIPVKCGTTAHQVNVTSQSLWLKSGDTVSGATSQLWAEDPDQFWTNLTTLATFCLDATGAPLWMVNKPSQATFATPPPKLLTSTSDGIWLTWVSPVIAKFPTTTTATNISARAR